MVTIDDVKYIYQTLFYWVSTMWQTSFRSWGIFGTWLISFAILRKIAKTFNKLKS